MKPISMLGALVALCVTLLIAGCGPPTDQARAIPRIGYLVLSPLAEPPSPGRTAFLAQLEKLGYVPGKTVELIYRSGEWDRSRLNGLAAELAAVPVDVLVAVSSEAAAAAKRASATLPIVFTPSSDPLRDGLVTSLARPGGNATGVSLYAPDLVAKRLDLIKEAFPHLQRVALIFDGLNPNMEVHVQAAETAAERLGLVLVLLRVNGVDGWLQALQQMRAEPVDALTVLGDSRTLSYREVIAEFALEERLPTVFDMREFVAAGGLMSYGPDLPGLFARAADYVDRILRGADPGTLPVQQPMVFDLVLNSTTARKLGRSISPSILMRADEVIE